MEEIYTGNGFDFIDTGGEILKILFRPLIGEQETDGLELWLPVVQNYLVVLVWYGDCIVSNGVIGSVSQYRTGDNVDASFCIGKIPNCCLQFAPYTPVELSLLWAHVAEVK